MVLIDGARHGFLEALVNGHKIAVAETALAEVVYYKDELGARYPIDLGDFLRSGALTVVAASADEMAVLLSRLPSRSLGSGELESLALVVSRGHRFCTADRVARRAMNDIGVGTRWVSLEELLGAIDPPLDVSDVKYRGT